MFFSLWGDMLIHFGNYQVSVLSNKGSAGVVSLALGFVPFSANYENQAPQ